MSKVQVKTKELLRFLLLIGLALLAFSYAMFQGGFVSWFLFFSFLPPALYAISLFLYSFSYHGERTFSKDTFLFHEPVRMHVALYRESRFPLFYLIAAEQLQHSSLLSDPQTKTVLSPGFKKKLTFTYEIDQMPRGEHHFTGIRLKTGDLFGLIVKEQQIPVENKIVVYPPLEDIQYRPPASSGDHGAAMTTASSYQHRDSSMAVGIRSYQPGDRLSLINWKATAKRSSLMTKEFEQHQSHDVMMVMDCTPSPQFEEAVSFTASAVKGIIRSGAQVGLLTVSDKRRYFQTDSSAGHEQQLFHHLATIQESGTASFAAVLEKEAAILQQNSTLLLVTTQLTKEAAERVRFYSGQGQSVAVFVVAGETAPATEQIHQPYGINVCVVQKGQFARAFAEVSRT